MNIHTRDDELGGKPTALSDSSVSNVQKNYHPLEAANSYVPHFSLQQIIFRVDEVSQRNVLGEIFSIPQ